MTQPDVLTAIDDALDTGRARDGDPVTRELQELALMLRADSPEPTREFTEHLGRRVERGFPKRAGSKPPWWRQFAEPAVAVLVVLVAVTGIALLARGGSGSMDDSSGGSSGESAAVSRGAEGDLAAPASGGGFAPGHAGRKIERTFSLELETPVDRMQRVAEQVTAVTNRHGGFVLSSSVSTGEDSSGGDFDLRIPATEVRPALRDLAALADVRSQSQTGRDVTPAYVTARDRLQAARAERGSLLRRLEAATTDTEAEAIRRRLDIVAGQINSLRGRLHALRLRTDYAVVTVNLQAKDGDQGGAGGGSFGDALGDAGDILVATAGILVRVLAVALPLALIALLGWVGGRLVQRRRRESALALRRSLSSWLCLQSPPPTSPIRPVPGPTPSGPRMRACGGGSATRSIGASS